MAILSASPDSSASPAASPKADAGAGTVSPSGPVPASQIWPVTVRRTSTRPDVTPQPGLYGEIPAAPRTDFAPLVTPAPGLDAWGTKPFGTMVSELSPAVLYRTALPDMTFFNGIEAWGHGGPTQVAVRTAAGGVVAGRGEQIDGTLQSEPWVLAWFAGAEGWMFDVPWLIVLERRPRSIALGAQGLRVRFDGPGGRLVA